MKEPIAPTVEDLDLIYTLALTSSDYAKLENAHRGDLHQIYLALRSTLIAPAPAEAPQSSPLCS